jgi:hypothetical protein
MSVPTKYTYSNLKEIAISGDCNFYGIIYDATYPTQDETPDSYVCTLKIIDQDINCLAFPTTLNDEIINLIIKSNSKDNLPYVHTVGDIIRVHRGYFVNIYLM